MFVEWFAVIRMAAIGKIPAEMIARHFWIARPGFVEGTGLR